jgi:hypothetical protein
MDKQTQLVKKLAQLAFPDYKGRKFRVTVKTRYYMQNYWDGGSRNYCVAVNLGSGQLFISPDASTQTPWNSAANSSFDIPQHVGILERCIFQGKDCGITLYVAPRQQECIAAKNNDDRSLTRGPD